LITFAEKYAEDVKKYGIIDQRFNSGAAALSNTFVKRILKSSSEIVSEIIKRELSDEPELDDEKYVTLSPTDIYKVIQETTDQLKGLHSKELALKILLIPDKFSEFYYDHLRQYISDDKFEMNKLIAVCNNTAGFFR